MRIDDLWVERNLETFRDASDEELDELWTRLREIIAATWFWTLVFEADPRDPGWARGRVFPEPLSIGYVIRLLVLLMRVMPMYSRAVRRPAAYEALAAIRPALIAADFGPRTKSAYGVSMPSLDELVRVQLRR